jgi:molybdopterin converting factor small subunit
MVGEFIRGLREAQAEDGYLPRTDENIGQQQRFERRVHGAGRLPITIGLPAPWRRDVRGQSAVELEPAETLEDALDQLVAREPALKERVFASPGRLRPDVSVYVNGQYVPPDRLETELADGAHVLLLHVAAGASPVVENQPLSWLTGIDMQSPDVEQDIASLIASSEENSTSQ